MGQTPSPWAARKNIRLGTSAHRPNAVSTARRLHPHWSALDQRLMCHFESYRNCRAHASTARGQSERDAYAAVRNHSPVSSRRYPMLSSMQATHLAVRPSPSCPAAANHNEEIRIHTQLKMNTNQRKIIYKRFGSSSFSR